MGKLAITITILMVGCGAEEGIDPMFGTFGSSAKGEDSIATTNDDSNRVKTADEVLEVLRQLYLLGSDSEVVTLDRAIDCNINYTGKTGPIMTLTVGAQKIDDATVNVTWTIPAKAKVMTFTYRRQSNRWWTSTLHTNKMTPTNCDEPNPFNSLDFFLDATEARMETFSNRAGPCAADYCRMWYDDSINCKDVGWATFESTFSRRLMEDTSTLSYDREYVLESGSVNKKECTITYSRSQS